MSVTDYQAACHTITEDLDLLSQPGEAAETLATYFKSVFNINHIHTFSANFQSSDSLSTASHPDSYVVKAIRHLHPQDLLDQIAFVHLL